VVGRGDGSRLRKGRGLPVLMRGNDLVYFLFPRG
jgi:hypothetical protein